MASTKSFKNLKDLCSKGKAVRDTLTSLDIAAIVLELKDQLAGARINNIYQVRGKIFLLKLHKPNLSDLTLLIELGKRLHLTSYLLEKPKQPPSFCMMLRKHLRNSVINEISQHEFERIVIITTRTKSGQIKLVLELFGDGNIILVDSNGIIKQALRLKKMRDRNILRGELFQHAPTSGKNPLMTDLSDLLQLRTFKKLEVVKALTRLLSISGKYAEELLSRSEVEKTKNCESLEDHDINRIHRALKNIHLCLKHGRLEPSIILDEDGRWLEANPIPLRKNAGFRCRKFNNFNEALDEFYEKKVEERELRVVDNKIEENVAKQQRILHEQQETLKRAIKDAKTLKEAGDKIYSQFNTLQAFLGRIMDDKRRGKTWKEIISQIEKRKKHGTEPARFFQAIKTEKLLVELSIGNVPLSLSLRKSAQDNASIYYNKAKKAKKKVKGAEKAIVETQLRIEKLVQEREIELEEAAIPRAKRKKKLWYERFRWFFTSENLLVVGGKDAVTNEILIKKHLEPEDLVFHADLVGAPFVILKTNSQTPSKESIFQAAQLGASYSRAWKNKFSAVDVYWVHPSQVSKTPPAGEYIQKGAFMIRGKKNYVRKTPLQITIGINLKTELPIIIGGPKQAIETQTNVYVEIVPGYLKSGKLAKEILNILKRKVSKELKDQTSRIPINEIQAFIPFGNGEIKRH